MGMLFTLLVGQKTTNKVDTGVFNNLV